MPDVSVVVRSRNDGKLIGKTLEMLLNQKFSGTFEILSADDRSTDGTAEIIGKYPEVRRLEGVPAPYVPGKTLNFAVKHAHGKIVVFNNADAVPLADDYLEKLISPLKDPAAAAVFGRQECRPDAEVLVRKDQERAFGDGKIAEKWGNFFSLASSAVKKELLDSEPFSERIQYSEDVEWANRMRHAGWKILYAPDAAVEHSHNYTPSELKKRFYNEGRADAAIYGKAPSFPIFLRQFFAESLRDFFYVLKRGNFCIIPQILPRRFRQKYSHYRGANDFLRENGKR